jgi:nicotinamidase/pyrazinamidase
MINRRALFWDVDTQFDFLDPQGKLYIPDGEKIIHNISEARRFALDNHFPIIASTDWHTDKDIEISENPDFTQSFPVHCLASEKGSSRVGYIGEAPVEIVGLDEMDTQTLKGLVDKEIFHIVIRKNKLDVFTNPNTLKLLELIRPEKVVVFGVTLEFCVYLTVHGLLRWGNAEVIVLRDVVKGIERKNGEKALKEFEEKGVKTKELNELRKGILDVVT